MNVTATACVFSLSTYFLDSAWLKNFYRKATKYTVMNTRSVISVNPAMNPIAAVETPVFVCNMEEPVRVMRKNLRMLLGIGGSVSHSRRIWTFRVIIGAILMCFGILFSHHALNGVTKAFLPGVSFVMVIGGAMIACGLLTRAVSVALGTLLMITAIHLSLMSMVEYSVVICIVFCIFAFACGSGRYSLDTIIYNKFSPNKFTTPQPAAVPVKQGCSSLRRREIRVSED